MKRKERNLIITVILALAVAYFFFNPNTFSIAIQGQPLNPTQDFTWGNIEGEVTATYFGSITNDDIEFCNSNDADVTLSNSIQTSTGNLVLKSSVRTDGRNCNGNTISARFIVGEGTLTGGCNLVAQVVDNGEARTICKIETPTNTLFMGEAEYEESFYNAPGTTQETPTFNLELDGDTEVIVTLITNAGQDSISNAEIELQYSPTSSGGGGGDGDGLEPKYIVGIVLLIAGAVFLMRRR